MVEEPARDEVEQLRELLRLAQERQRNGRRVIFDNISDLFLSAEGRLSDRERALMSEILSALLREMEMQLRRDLAQRLASLANAPHDLIVALANDEIEVARPLLMQSRVLRDGDLVEIVKRRSEEHLLAIAMRSPLSEEVSQALVDEGDENVIEQLLKNPDAALSRRALEYLVAEAQRVGRFQEPLLHRAELPAELAHRLFWWVSAALREHILARYDLDEAVLDDYLEDTTRVALEQDGQPTADRQAELMVDRLAAVDELNETFLVRALRGGRVPAFVAAFARLTRLSIATVRQILFDPGGEPLAVACRAIGIERANFVSLFLLSRQGQTRVAKPDRIQHILEFYDRLPQKRARVALRYWRAEGEYMKAVATLKAVEPAAGVSWS